MLLCCMKVNTRQLCCGLKPAASSQWPAAMLFSWLPPRRQDSCHNILAVQIKTEEELAVMRYANQVASAAHVQVSCNVHYDRQLPCLLAA